MRVRKGKRRTRVRIVKEIEKSVALLDKCLEVCQRKKLKTAEFFLCMAQLELRKQASRLLET